MNQKNLINGQRPEFGNPDHIAWLKDQRRIAELKENGGTITDFKIAIESETTYDVWVKFDCINCRKPLTKSFRSHFEDEWDVELKCSCGMKYLVDNDSEIEVLKK